MKNLAIIPARGGSKRIPRKNIKDFLGKPIIAYSIEAAIESGLFDKIMVSTDDEEIAAVAEKYGAKVPFMRSEKNSDDYASTFDVIEEVILRYKKQNEYFERCCCIYPCAPLISIKSLTHAYKLLDNFDSVFPVVSFSYPIQRALRLDELSKVSFFHPKYIKSRSQDLEKAYHDAGQFYWFNVEKVLNERKILTENTGSVILSELQVQDVDNEADWEMAKVKYNKFKL